MSPNPGCPGRLGAILLAAVMLSACGAGATQSPAPTLAPSASPVAVTDEALVADLAAVWGDPYDAAKVETLYAPTAEVLELTDANLTSKGLEAIQARIKALAEMDFEAVVTSPMIRQGSFLAAFHEYGTGGDLSGNALVVYQLKDGKVLKQWVYGESSPADASPPAADAAEALVADLAAVMSNPYDAAKVAALYAPQAVIHETTAGMTQLGLDEIGARIREFNTATFSAEVTSPVIRQGDFLAAFHKYGTGGDLSSSALVVYQLKDGKVLSQWIYPAP